MNVLINCANALFVLGYFTTDLLRLRLLSTVATACVVTYFWNQPDPLMSVVGWNLVFLLLNVVQLGLLLRARWPRLGPGFSGTAAP